MGVSSLLLGMVSTSAPSFGASVRMVKKRDVQPDGFAGTGEYFPEPNEECLDERVNCCAPGYEYKHGDITGWGQLAQKEFGHDVWSCDLCAQSCTDWADGLCGSYECSPDKFKCNWNMMGDPSAPPFEDFRFCKKIVEIDPNQPDWFDNRNDLLEGDWSSMTMSGEAYVTFGLWSAGACGSYNGEGQNCITGLCSRHPGVLCERYLNEGKRTLDVTQGIHMGGVACGSLGQWGGCAFWELRTLSAPAVPVVAPAPAPAPAPTSERRRRRRRS